MGDLARIIFAKPSPREVWAHYVRVIDHLHQVGLIGGVGRLDETASRILTSIALPKGRWRQI